MPKPLLVVDPGHGGADPGAVNDILHLAEKDINLRLAFFLEEIALGSGRSFDTVLTRRADVYLPMGNRVRMANNLRAAAFLSLHCNAANDHTARGYEVWTSPGETPADALATALFAALARSIPGAPGRADYDDGDPDKETNFYVLRYTMMPAVLVEVEFISNLAGAMFLDDDANLERVAMALARAADGWFAGVLP